MIPNKGLLKKTLLVISAVMASAVVIFAGINIYINRSACGKIITAADAIGQADAVLVLGAAVGTGGRPSGILNDRLNTGVELYTKSRARKILISGDHGKDHYDEIKTMKKYLLKAGVPPGDLFIDHAGFSTFDSIVRSKQVFNARSLIIVTQEYHLPRAIFIAEKAGLSVLGAPADRGRYSGIAYFMLREYFANIKAVGDVIFNLPGEHPAGTVDIHGDGRTSWKE